MGSVGERHCAVAGELHERAGALELGVVDELSVVEVAILEADGTDIEAANKVIQEFGGPCTIEQGTTFTTAFGSVWSSADDPLADTEAEQLAVALAIDREIVRGVTVTVDDGMTVDIHTPRFELFSPQRTVLLPPDAIFDLHGPQIVTLTAHAWGAAVRKLSLGQHTIVVDVTFSDGFVYSVPHIVNVVPKHSH
jgi:hypothetical protein